jgi:AcrR family transcriptional regulator
MRFAIASACSRRPKRCSALVARRRASRRWRGVPALASARCTGIFREALFEAVYRREVEHLADLAEQLKGEVAPAEALRRWLRSNVEFVGTKKGMSAALALAAHSSSELYAYTFDRLTKAVAALLERAVAAGEIRADISPEDLLRALVGMCYMHDHPGLAGQRAAPGRRLRRRLVPAIQHEVLLSRQRF